MIVNDTENASSWSQEECRRCASCNVICAMAIACSASIGPPLLPAALRHARATGRRAWDASSCCYLPDLLPRSYFQKAGSWAVGISQAQQFGLDGKSLSFRAHMVDWHYDTLCDIYIYKICSYTMLYRGSICLKIVQETTQIPARRCWHTTETWDKICLRRGHAWLLGAWQSPVRLAQLGESFDRPGFVSVCSGLLGLPFRPGKMGKDSQSLGMEFREYRQNSSMLWHSDQILLDPPQLELVYTLENSSDSVTRWSPQSSARLEKWDPAGVDGTELRTPFAGLDGKTWWFWEWLFGDFTNQTWELDEEKIYPI